MAAYEKIGRESVDTLNNSSESVESETAALFGSHRLPSWIHGLQTKQQRKSRRLLLGIGVFSLTAFSFISGYSLSAFVIRRPCVQDVEESISSCPFLPWSQLI